MQRDGKEYKASDVSYTACDGYSGMEADITGAYPAEAGIKYWRRSCGLHRGGEARVEITDTFSLKNPTADTVYHFMAAAEPVINGKGEIMLLYGEGKKALLTYDGVNLRAETEKIAVTESRLQANWGEVLYRINLIERERVKEGERRVSIRLILA
jgi:hypothetical protein